MKKNSTILLLLLLTNKIQNMFSIIQNTDNYDEYLSYCEKYNKAPSNFRYTIWRAKLKRLETINKINKKLKDFKVGFTKFSDLTLKERKSFLSPIKNRKRNPKLQNSFEIRESINSFRSKLRRRYENLKYRIKGEPQNFLSEFTKKYPSEKNWVKEDKVTNIKDQGECGSCWAFAVAAAIESIYLIKKNETYDLSEQEMIDCADKMDCEGGWNDLAIDYIKKNKISQEEDYKYIEKNGKCDVDVNNVKISIKDFKRVETKNMEAFLIALSEQPISVGFQVEDDFLDYKSGVIDGDRLCGTTDEINHAVLAVGYKIGSGFDDNYILFKNQWGSDWGEDGYFRFKFYDEKVSNGPCNSIRYEEDLVYPVLAS